MGLFSRKHKNDADAAAPGTAAAVAKKPGGGIGSLFKGDRVIWVVYFFLCVVSVVEVYSAASSLSYKTGNFWEPLIKQVLFLLGGTVIVVAVHRVPCRFFKAIPVLGWVGSIVLLLVALMIGASRNGASRWIPLGPFTFQPSEVAKGVVVITTAWILALRQGKDGADKKAFRQILFESLVIVAFIVTENLSTAALLFGVVIMMMFIGRVPLVQMGKLFGVMALLGVLMGILVYFSDDLPLLHRFETWKARVETHFSIGDKDKKADPKTYDIDKGAQVAHANIAIVQSNVLGRAPGNSVQRDFLSQAFSDFIYAIIIEETGIIGAFFVLMLYIILLFRAGRIASRCERSFPPFLIMGLTLLLVSQAMLNMMVAVGLFPVTGQPLPLISRGGTSTIINCFYFGMILSVSRYARQVKEPQPTQFDGSMADICHE